MLISNPLNNHAYVVGEVLQVSDRDEFFLAKVKHHYYDREKRNGYEVVTDVYFRNIEDDSRPDRSSMMFADRARRMKLRAGSRVGVYCAFCGEGMKTAKGYGINYDGITCFNGVNHRNEPTKFCIVIGEVKSMTDRVDKNGEPYVLAHVYIGKWPMRDSSGNILHEPDGTPIYIYRNIEVRGRDKMISRFKKVLQRDAKGIAKTAAFLCAGEPFSYISLTDGSQREIYSALNFEVMGMARRS